MSYSFTVKAENAALALAEIERELDLVVERQPIHAADKDAALACAKAVLDTVVQLDNHSLSITMSGSVSKWHAGVVTEDVTSVGVGVNVSQVPL